MKPKYLIAFTVGFGQKVNVDACVKKVKSYAGSLLYLKKA